MPSGRLKRRSGGKDEPGSRSNGRGDGKSGVNMNRLYSRTALKVSSGYAALAVGLTIYIWRMSDAEGAGFGFLFYGLPWSLAAVFTNCFSLKDPYCLFLVLILNTATVYSFVLAGVR